MEVLGCRSFQFTWLKETGNTSIGKHFHNVGEPSFSKTVELLVEPQDPFTIFVFLGQSCQHKAPNQCSNGTLCDCVYTNVRVLQVSQSCS